MIPYHRVGDFLEWRDVPDGAACEWAVVEKTLIAQLQASGDFTRVDLLGSLFEGDADPPIVASITPARVLVSVTPVPWRVRPLVLGGPKTTVRLYVPRA